jgi:alpha-D-xyloside xylohydrolase
MTSSHRSITYVALALLLAACGSGSTTTSQQGGSGGQNQAGTGGSGGATSGSSGATSGRGGSATGGAGSSLTGGSGGTATGGSGTNPTSGAGGTAAGGSGGSVTGGTSGQGTGGAGGTARGGSAGTANGGAGGTATTGAGGTATGGAGTNPTGGAGGGVTGGSGGSATGGSSGTGGTFACSAPPPTSSAYTVDTTGVTFSLSAGKMRVQVCQADIIRVQYTTASSIPSKTSLSVNNTWATPTTFCVTEASGTVTISTERIKVKVNASTGVASYTDATDHAIVAEVSKSLTAATISGSSTNKVQASFTSSANEGLFGLGQHQDGVVNKKGKQVHFHNVNNNTQGSATQGGDITIPLLVSSEGYGIYWDNAADGDFFGNDSNNTAYRFSSNAGDMVDYYFLYGPTIDQVVTGYRIATGAAPLFPKWAYGLFHSKDAYASQSELLAVKDGYRNAKIPVDCIVQDWNYWTPYGQGSHIMDPSRYPDPTKLVSDMHAANVHTMISIWPRYELKNNPPLTTGENDNYNALKNINALFMGGTPGYPPPYDTWSADARTLVYQQIYDRLLGKYGWDAIWADATEPEGVDLNTVTTAIGKGFLYINSYPLEHSRALYEGWRKVGPSGKRVYVLTRSGFGGQQRYAASVWSGDINSDWSNLVRQLPAGLGYALSGMPYWTSDIGGYFGHNTNWSSTQNNELFTRWFQFGAFCSLFRIHGGGSRELYGSQWSATTKANLLLFDNLHYRLMPYIYSLAWKVTSEHYTIMRPLVFDFQSDATVYNIKDQFMFGPAFLVNPVTTAGATSRSVYLPAGTWYDFWTGATTNGGTTSSVSAPLNLIPLFVRAGSIVPMGPMIQYATQNIDPLEIRIYKGGNASFTLYEDEGDTYNYETGKYSQIQFTWDDAAGRLTIGARTGSYSGMPTTRTFNIVWVGANHGTGVDVTSTADQAVKYDGSAVVVTAN